MRNLDEGSNSNTNNACNNGGHTGDGGSRIATAALARAVVTARAGAAVTTLAVVTTRGATAGGTTTRGAARGRVSGLAARRARAARATRATARGGVGAARARLAARRARLAVTARRRLAAAAAATAGRLARLAVVARRLGALVATRRAATASSGTTAATAAALALLFLAHAVVRALTDLDRGRGLALTSVVRNKDSELLATFDVDLPSHAGVAGLVKRLKNLAGVARGSHLRVVRGLTAVPLELQGLALSGGHRGVHLHVTTLSNHDRSRDSGNSSNRLSKHLQRGRWENGGRAGPLVLSLGRAAPRGHCGRVECFRIG